MNEKKLVEALDKALEPIEKAHQEYLKKTMEAVKDAFEIGLAVGKLLKK